MCDNFALNFLRVCGQYPVKKSPTQKWQTSWIGITYNIAFLIAVLLGYNYSYAPFLIKNSILNCAFLMANTSFSVSLLCIGINPLIRSKKICRILDTFDDIDEKFSSLGHYEKYVKPQILTIVVAILVTLYTCMTQVLEYFFPLWSRGFATYYFHQAVVYCATLFLANWWYIASQLQVRFALLNTIMANMRIYSETSSRLKESEFWARKLVIRSVRTAPISIGADVEESIMTLRQVHLLLCQNSQEIMSLHSPSILFIVLNCFMQTMCNMYYCIDGLINDSSSNQTWTYLVGILNWNGSHILQMACIVSACIYCKQEAEKIAFTIHSRTARLRDIPRQMFVYQASQQELKCSPWGIFTLDFSLMLSMFSQIITYLVIVMNIKTEEKPEKS